MSFCRAFVLAVAAAALALLPGAPAAAAPVDDFGAVFGDWQRQPAGTITPCAFTPARLRGALAATGTDTDAYAPGFRDAVRRELARHAAGGCRGSGPGARSPLRRLRIVKIRPRGGSRESVVIRNTGRKAVRLRGATLRDRGGRRIRLGRGKLGARRSLRVYTGCLRGSRRVRRRGARLYACLRRRVWDDRGDIVRIVDRRGVTVAQRGYGRLRRAARF
ncbi:MAG: lamin tail domain-containing protein [Thermoleophilaceae bacterium]